MKKIATTAIVLIVLSFAATVAMADRGTKKKNRLKFKIASPSSLRSSISLNLRSGMVFKGSQSINLQKSNNSISDYSIVSYRNGNTLYILPYKQKVLIPSYDRASGYKLVIRPK